MWFQECWDNYGRFNWQLSTHYVVENEVHHTTHTHSSFSSYKQHHIDGEDSKVRSVALSSYELQSAERDVSLLQKKRDVLAVCLAHLVVIWTVVPGLQWTVLHKWSLPLVRALYLYFTNKSKLIICLWLCCKSYNCDSSSGLKNDTTWPIHLVDNQNTLEG